MSPHVEVSVVVPTHDRPRLLKETLEAIAAQTWPHFEVVVVDDGSGCHVSCPDERFRVVRHQRNQGVAAARNTGIAAARGRLVAFCDDDDTWFPDKLAAQVEAIAVREWCVCGSVVVDAAGRPMGEQALGDMATITSDLRHANVVPGGCSGVLAVTEVVRELGGFDPSLSIFADWDLWLRLAARSAPGVVARPLLAHRVHAGQMATDAREAASELRALRDKHGLDDRCGGVGEAFPPMWILRRANRTRFPERARALAAVWDMLPLGHRVRAIASTVQPAPLRDYRDRRRGRRLEGRIPVPAEHPGGSS